MKSESYNMNLQHFFTQIEMTDGLASLPRVEQLVSLIHQDECHITGSAAEATRQWSTVASILTATQNTDCLRQFIKLGGVRYLDICLQEAQKINIDACNKSVEELISLVLVALVKLPIDQEGLEACGIGNTVRHLHYHKSREIQGKAKNLSDVWDKFTNVETQSENIENKFCHEYENSGCTAETMPLMEGELSNCERITTSIGVSGNDSKDKFSIEGISGTTVSRYDRFESDSPKEVTGGGVSMNAEVAMHSLEGIASTLDIPLKGETVLENGKTFKPAESEESGVEEKNSFQEVTVADGSRSMMSVASNDKQPKTVFSASNSETFVVPASSLSDGCQNGDENLAIPGKIDACVKKLGRENADPQTRKGLEVEIRYELDDALEVARQVAREVEQEVEIYREVSVSSSSIEDRNGEPVFFSTAESKELGSISESSRSKQDSPDSCCSNKEVDPETSTGNEQLHLEVNDLSQETRPEIPKTDDGQHEQDSSPLMKIPKDLSLNYRPYICYFDLNENLQTEEVEFPEQSVTEALSSCHVKNLSTPIPVVATSRGPVYLPTSPLHFEGELGWKGSAATSAFRPASLCRSPDKEKACSTEENNCSSKQSQSCRGIDLNVADADNDSVMELLPEKHVPVSSNLLSGDSSVEVSSRRAERLNLDLNRLGDNDDNCPDLLSDWTTGCRLHPRRNGAGSPSPTSSPRLSSIRDFDLNDNPSPGEVRDIHRPVPRTWPSNNKLLDDHAVSIFGSTMGSICRKEYLMHPAQPLLTTAHNVPAQQFGRMVVMQPSLDYAQPAFSYNGFGMGAPIGPAVPIPSAVYPSGGVQYMMDSRGGTILPQILGSGAYSTFPRTPYLIDPSGTKDVGIFKPNLDLNAGVTSSEAETRGNVRHVFFPASNNPLMEEHVKSFQQVTVSSSSMKRKEPECGWDPYQVGYKQVTSWR